MHRITFLPDPIQDPNTPSLSSKSLNPLSIADMNALAVFGMIEHFISIGKFESIAMLLTSFVDVPLT